jgi:hypothetical protein
MMIMFNILHKNGGYNNVEINNLDFQFCLRSDVHAQIFSLKKKNVIKYSGVSST